MKKCNKIIGLLMSVAMLLCTLCSTSFAAVTPEDWESYMKTDSDADMGLIMQPGSDEGERNFSWYAPIGSTECCVKVSENADMSGFVEFTGRLVKTYQGDFAAKVTVTGLKENTRYYYFCSSGGRESAVYSFLTDDGSFCALYVSDIHVTGGNDADDATLISSSYKFNRVLESALALQPSLGLVLSAGDQASNGVRREYTALTASASLKTLSFSTAIGNHDTKSVDYRYFNNVPNEQFALVNSYQGGDYWFVKGSVLFLVIDSNNASGIDHAAFLAKAVKANPDVKWKIAVYHHDLYSKTIPSREQENSLLRALWSPLMDEYGVDMVLLGHSHRYCISDVLYNGKSVEDVTENCTLNNPEGTVYMVTGSVGDPKSEADTVTYSEFIGVTCPVYDSSIYNIIDFSDDALTVKSYTVGNGLFNTLTITKDENAGAKGGIGFFRKLSSMFCNIIGTIFAVFNNISDSLELREKGYDVSVVKSLFNNNSVDGGTGTVFDTIC